METAVWIGSVVLLLLCVGIVWVASAELGGH